MRTLLKVSIASLIAATAMGTTPVVQAQGFSIDAPGVHVGVGDRYHRRYYDYDRDYDRGGRTWNGCRPGWTVQGGECRPYRGLVGPSWGYR